VEPDDVFERITGKQPTLLPISFLETGLIRARSIARVVTPEGFGTGFLTRDNLLITNNHVIPSEEVARDTKVQFNFEETAKGLSAEVAEFGLDPAGAFATSPADGGHDWTAVRVQGDPNATWGRIELRPASVKVDDYVNIIQHPGGLPKQIGLYHNVVVYADDAIVQYLTDTLPGSSGSPVFDSHWRVVALHHSGGLLQEPGSKQLFFRNEGIAVATVLRDMAARGLRVS
jgi:V8-like Glu-specific endopeptidase